MKRFEAAVADAGPLIHLDELDWLFVLETFNAVWVPAEVSEEASAHRPAWRTAAPDNVFIESVPEKAHLNHQEKIARLDKGERAALALCQERSNALFPCDDLQARIVADEMNIQVMGNLGLLLPAARYSLRTKVQVRSVLKKIPTHSTLHLKSTLPAKAIKALQES